MLGGGRWWLWFLGVRSKKGERIFSSSMGWLPSADEVIGFWEADKRTGDVAAVCGCIPINNPCKSKPSELNCYSDCRDCCIDRWQWQIMIRRTILGSAYTNTVMELKLFQFGFTTTISTPSCIAYHYRRARSRGLLICKEMMLLYVKFGCYTMRSCQAAGRPVFAFFVPFGCICRGQLR
jgi:hypothetical protein